MASVLRLLRIRRGEEAAALWTVGLFAVTQASQGLGANTADTLFFLRFGVEFLPTMILLAGPVVMLGVLAYAAGLGRLGAGRWLPVVLAGSGGWLVLERIGITADVPGIYPVVWLMGQVVIMVSFTAMWTAAGEVCTTRQAKRLFPLFASAGIAGGVIGNAATGPLARALGTENLLFVQTGLLVAAGLVALSVGKRFFQTDSSAAGSVLADFRAGLRATARSPLLRIVAWGGLALGVLFFLVVFPFSEVVTRSLGAETQVAGYLGIFSSIATAATFLVSLLAANRLFARFGVVATLMVVPLVYLAGFGLWLVSFDLATATLVRGLQWVAVNALGATAWSSLFNVLSRPQRGQVMAFMTAGPAQLGTMVSGALLLAGSLLPMQARTLLGVAIALATLVLVSRMRKAYSDALVEAVDRGLVDVFTAPTTGMQKPTFDADMVRAMRVSLEDPRPEARAMAVAMLGRLQDDQADSLVLEVLTDKEARVRIAALDVLSTRGDKWRGHTESLLADPDPSIRRRTLEMIWEGRDFLLPAVEPALEDPAPEVRAMAAVIVGGKGAQEVVEALLGSEERSQIVAGLGAVSLRLELTTEDLVPYLTHPDRRVRVAAAPAAARLPGNAARVRDLLDDPSILARRSAAAALTTSPEGVAALLQVLDEGSVRACDAALRALVESGQAGGALATWASQEIARAAFLRRHRLALQQHSASNAGRYLARLLQAREERLETWAIMAITTRETEAALGTVIRGMWSTDGDTRSQALEALDSIADRSVARDLLALLEDEASETATDARSSLRVLAEDFDPWIRALAYSCLGEELMGDLERLNEAARGDPSPLVRVALSRWELQKMQETETLDIIERLLALQRVPMFSEIDPEDLERVADVTTERRYDPDEVIFREGDEGDEMLLIIGGEVIACHIIGGEVVLIRTIGPGDHVGELALLRGRPRASDVVAGKDGATALALRSPELQAILEERPEVAMAMLGTLAERLATT